MKRRYRKSIQEAALLQFQLSSVRRPEPAAHIQPPFDPTLYQRPTWSQRAKLELEAAMELDLEPDRVKRRRYVPSYERVATHLKEKGFY